MTEENSTEYIKLSPLPKTWFIDIDGTILKHNGYEIDGYDTLLDGVEDFFKQLPENDKVILVTSRKKEQLQTLKDFLSNNNIKYDYILTDMPMGERILINDNKPSGLKCAYAIPKKRDDKFIVNYKIDTQL